MTRRDLLWGLAAAPAADALTLADFRTPTQTTGPEVSWRSASGELEAIGDARRQCDLWTKAAYESFDFQFEWKVAPGANTGIKYLIQGLSVDQLRDSQGEFVHEATLGYEFQLIDDASSAGRAELHASGALYNYLAPVERAAHPAGEWNSGRLVVEGTRVEHWINGRRVLAFTLGSPELLAALGRKKLNSARMMERLAKRRTPVALQHHESRVWFRSLRMAGERFTAAPGL